MKHIVGLDLGPNSIGWSAVGAEIIDGKEQLTGIIAAGSRIIPMDAAIIGDFEKGASVSQTSTRTGYRGVRRLRQRELLRRERALRVLDILGFLPPHYSAEMTRYGKFRSPEIPKLAWAPGEDGKLHFLFVDSFNEMMKDFADHQPQLIADGKKIPYDWTIYYLRQKALTQKISKEELAWILLNFNQKRGYYQLRGEDEEDDKPAKTRQYFDRQVVTSIVDTGEVYKKLKIFNVQLANGEVGKIFKPEMPDWVGREKSIIVTVDLDKDGNDRLNEDGTVSRRFKVPTEAEWDSEWALIKIKTQNDLEKSGETVGSYIYNALLRDPSQKIKGKLVRTVDRRFYRDELLAIVKAQMNFHPELQSRELYQRCIHALYQSNESYRNSIASRDFAYLLVDDILFYQRPLKSKKSLIENCAYEASTYVKDGETIKVPLKGIAKSNPLFQEFRLWQFLSNLRIYRREQRNLQTGNLDTDVDVTDAFLTGDDAYARLFDWLNTKKEFGQAEFLKSPEIGLKKDNVELYRWNYAEDVKIKGNETRAQILSDLKKANVPSSFLTPEIEAALWHILYSIDDKEQLKLSLRTFAAKHNLPDTFVEVFAKSKPFEKAYGSYSSKATKKLLSVMRRGYHWREDAIPTNVKERIYKLINGEYDETIDDRTREKVAHLTKLDQFSGLPLWLACYVVYGRHSEAKDIQKWETPDDIDKYLKSFRQHSLHNPIVEQVVTETLRTVRDLWRQIGSIDEIHIELGRELKNPADKRAKIAAQIQENENVNLRIKALLTEFMNDDFGIPNVRPSSPSQQDKLRIYEDGAISSVDKLPDDIAEIIAKLNKRDKAPTHAEFMRYKLWLEQQYRSPYTGEPIPLAKLFTPAYEIEHIIPQKRYFDDSFSNKVICESEVNGKKGALLGYEFINAHPGEIVPLAGGRTVKIFTPEQYEQFVNQHYVNNSAKKRKLLMADIPEQFIQRQLNDTRYISKLVKGLLSNIVREDDEQEATSKNVISCVGSITDRLKKDWGANDVWNCIVRPRFKRMNIIDPEHTFTATNNEGKTIPSMPLDLQQGFNKKRIDHRHHAMDAIVIACANRNIVNYLNNASASKTAATSRYDLQKLICSRVNTDDNGNYKWVVNKPWNSFTVDLSKALEYITVSFKQNLRVINKSTNYYQHFNADGKKEFVKQTKGDNWAIRKPLHKETVFGEVNLRMTKTVSLKDAIANPKRIVDKELKKAILALLSLGQSVKEIKTYFEEKKEKWPELNLSKIEIYYFTKETKDHFYATRKAIDTGFTEKDIENSVTDTGIRKIMLRHLSECGGDPNVAFSPEGIEQMNRDIRRLNDGVDHKPIYKVRKYEKANKFNVGEAGNKRSKFVESAKGTNLFLAVYETEVLNKQTGETEKKRSYETIPLQTAISRLKQGLSPAPANEEDVEPIFVLSPNDLVYLPTEEQLTSGNITLETIDKNRIYKMVSSSGPQCFFVKHEVAKAIVDKKEFSPLNKQERAITGETIKKTCIPIVVDRLGNISLKS